MKLKILSGDSVKDKNNRNWIWDRNHNLIGFLDIEDYTFHIAGKYEGGSFCGFHLYLLEETIYITSQNKIEILAYDTEKGNFHIYKSNIEKRATQYYSARLSQSKIMLIAYELRYPAVIFDMSNGKFEEVLWLENTTYGDQVIGRVEDSNDEILIPVNLSNEIIVVNKKNLKYSKIYLNSIKKLSLVSKSDMGDMWIASNDGNTLVRYHEGEETAITMDDTHDNKSFSKLKECGSKIIAIPRYGEKIYVYNEIEKQVQTIQLPMDVKVPVGTSSLFWGCIGKGEKLIFLPWRYPQIVEIDLKEYTAKNYCVTVSVEEFRKYIEMDPIYEGAEMDVADFIEYLVADR